MLDLLKILRNFVFTTVHFCQNKLKAWVDVFMIYVLQYSGR